MTALAASVLAGLVVNFGFATYALREIGAATREQGRQIMSGVLCARIMLGGVVFLTTLLTLPWLPQRWQALVALLMLAQVFDAVTDLLNVGFRATRRYASETRITAAASVLQFSLVSGGLMVAAGPLMAAAAYAGARALVLFLTWRGQRSFFGGLRPAPWREGLARIRSARAYAVDYGMQALFGQIDSLVIAHFFGTAAVGLYQAGMRLFLGGSQAASVLGNVAIPHLSGHAARGSLTDRQALRVQWAFVIVGLSGGLAFALLPAALLSRLLGAGYGGLGELMPWFGLLFLVRLCAAGAGLMLTVHGRQGTRAVLTAAHWLIVAALATVLLPTGTVVDWLVALVVGNAALFVSYAVTMRQNIPMSGLRNVASLAGGVLILGLALQHL